MRTCVVSITQVRRRYDQAAAWRHRLRSVV